jgi:hypothetical protein
MPLTDYFIILKDQCCIVTCIAGILFQFKNKSVDKNKQLQNTQTAWWIGIRNRGKGKENFVFKYKEIMENEEVL